MGNTPFKLRSQGSSFKMMGSSPLKSEGHGGDEGHTHEGDKATTANIIAADKEYTKLQSKELKRKGAIETRYGGKWTNLGQIYNKRTGNFTGGWRNEEGQSVSDVEQSLLEEIPKDDV